MDVNEYIELNLVHSLHNSQRMSHRGCKRKYDWIYRHGYYPQVTAKPLEFGVAFHKAMETFYNPSTWNDKEVAEALAKVVFVATCDEQFKEFSRLNPGLVGPEVAADYQERKDLGLGMLKHYFKYESPAHDDNLTPVHVEISFEVPISGPNGQTLWCKCTRCWTKQVAYWKSQGVDVDADPSNEFAKTFEPERAHSIYTTMNKWTWRRVNGLLWDGLPVTFGGRIDCLVKDAYGRYWIVDWKTAAKLSTGEPGADDDFLWLDDQITGYCWAMWVLGIKIAGFVYAEIKKAVPEEPEPNKTIRLGRMFSVNRQINTTYEMYFSTVRDNDPVAFSNGLYDDFFEFLRSPAGPKYHLRHQIHRTEYELQQAGVNLYNEACDILAENARIYPTPGRFSCGYCAFKEPCLSKNRGEDYLYTLETLFDKRTKHYFEESEPSTDKAKS